MVVFPGDGGTLVFVSVDGVGEGLGLAEGAAVVDGYWAEGAEGDCTGAVCA